VLAKVPLVDGNPWREEKPRKIDATRTMPKL
jgi:hypothetical protein